MSPLRFDLETLKARLGERRFKRAEGYAERGHVQIVAIEQRVVSALVSGEGGSVYGVDLDEMGAGACSCPDFRETGACKHIGAVALTADGVEPAAARGLNGRIGRLRASLAFDDAAGLTEIIVSLAKRVPGVVEVLEAGFDPESAKK